jgi:hypothetical protein
MRRQLVFMLLMMLLGAIAGIAVFGVLTAIAMPGFLDMPLTLDERAGYELMEKRMAFFSKYYWLLTPPMLVMAVVCFIYLLRVLNPGIGRAAMKDRTGLLKTLAAGAALLVCVAGAFMMFGSIYNVRLGLRPDHVLLMAGLYAFAWGISGSNGWAGDLRSMEMGAGRRGLIESLFLGAMAGGVVAALAVLVNWSMWKYYILVSEVLDGTGDTSYSGLLLLFKGIVFFSVLSLGIFGGAAAALAPVRKRPDERIKLLFLPGALAIVMCAVIVTWYGDASARYDLDKKDLAEAAGLTVEPQAERSFLPLMEGAMPVPQSLEVSTMGIVSIGNTVATEENLRRLDEYLKARPGGSVFKYEAMSALYYGRQALWQPREGRRLLHEFVDHGLIYRLLLMRQVAVGAATEENASYLRGFMDEEKWALGKRHSARLADALLRMGLLEDAARWHEKAIALGAGDGWTEALLPRARSSGFWDTARAAGRRPRLILWTSTTFHQGSWKRSGPGLGGALSSRTLERECM